MARASSDDSNYTKLKFQVEQIADQLCQSVDGNFDFVISQEEEDESVQKLSMLVNFLIDSARRSVEEEQKQKKALEELDQLKSNFMANISHELRTPLTLILSPLETMLANTDNLQFDKQRKEITRMTRNAYRLYTLVDDLLDFSKAEAKQLELNLREIKLGDLMTSLTDDMQPLARKKNISLQLFFEMDNINILLDEKLFEKIVINLIGNAIKFTPKNGEVSVTVKKNGNDFLLIVTDTGVGIPDDKISVIFDRFRQVEDKSTRQYGGTGLGLAVVKEFVHLMKGAVSVESELNRGSKFQVRLPIIKPKKSKIKENSFSKEKTSDSDFLLGKNFILNNLEIAETSESSNIEGQTKNDKPCVVLADDNDDLREYITENLNKDYNIIAVENGILALEAIKNYLPSVVISDIMMPEMDGISLVSAIKSSEKLKQIPVILLTARSGKEAVVSGLSSGADDYLTKPFSLSELQARVAAAFRLHQTYLTLEEKTKELESALISLENLNQKMLKISREAGMSEVASGILHNVGNVLNSVNVSTVFIRDLIGDTKTYQRLLKITDLIKAHAKNIGEYLTKDETGKLLPEYLVLAIEQLDKEHKKVFQESKILAENIEHIKTVISTQQSYVKPAAILEPIDINKFLSEVVQLQKHSFRIEGIKVECHFDDRLQKVVTDKHKLLTILMNLFRNSIYALQYTDPKQKNKRILIKTSFENDDFFAIEIIDNGVGITKENLNLIFTQGFTTKKEGTGYGLHSSLLTAQELGGTLKGKSQGHGLGACFILELPKKS